MSGHRKWAEIKHKKVSPGESSVPEVIGDVVSATVDVALDSASAVGEGAAVVGEACVEVAGAVLDACSDL